MIKVLTVGDIIPTAIYEMLTPEILSRVVYNVSQAARGHWIKLASEDNKVGSHWRFDYINGIQTVKMTKTATAVISLVGAIPHMLEDGSPSVDLRDSLLGPNVPVVPVGERGKHENKKGGHYRAIPFRHTTPGKKRGKTIGQAMGSAYAAIEDSKKLGKEVYKAAKQLSSTISGVGRKVVYGDRLEAGLAPLLRSHHKTDIYAGMIREEKIYEKATQYKYTTFRTISTSVNTGWIRQSIPARHYVNDVSSYVAKLLPKAVAAVLEG